MNELLDAARAGDRRAIEALFDSQIDRVVALCRRMVGRAEAEDLAQEALIAVFRGLDRFDGRSAFPSWVYRITVNVCLDELRRRGRRVEVDDSADATLVPSSSYEDPSRVADRLDLDAALAELQPDFRAAVVLRDLCDLDYAEIGRILDLPPGTVRSRIKRGREALMKSAQIGNRSDDTVVQPVWNAETDSGSSTTTP